MAGETPEKKVDALLQDEQNKMEQEAKEKEKVRKNTDKWLNALEENMVNEYFAWKMQKKFSDCTPEEKEAINELTDLVDKRIKKLQRVPLDITINSWIGWLMSVVSIFNPQASKKSLSSEQLDQISQTTEKMEWIWDWVESKMWAIFEQFHLQNSGIDMQELQTAFTTLETKVVSLKSDKKKLKELAKANNTSMKAYYFSQTRAFKNEFLTILKWWQPTVKSQVDAKQSWVEATKTPEQLRTDAVEWFITKAMAYKWHEYARGWQWSWDQMDCSWLIYAAWKDMGITNNPEFERTTASVLYNQKVDKIPDIKNVKRWDLLFHKAKIASANYGVWDIRHVMISLSWVKNDNDGKWEYVEILDSRETQTNNNQAWEWNQDVSVRKQYLSESDNEILAWTPTKSYEAMASVSNTVTDIVDNDNWLQWDYDDLEYPTADPNLDDLKYIATSDMVPVEKMRSWIIEKNPKTWTTLCSKTAADNLQRLWVKWIQRGNAFDVKDMYWNTYKTWQKIWDAEIVSIQDTFTNTITWNTFDIFIPAKSEKNKAYWHRLVWFRSEPSNQIYVLDPYNVKNNGKSGTQPMKIEDFIKNICETQKRDIVKIVGYNTKKKVVDNEQIIAQMKQERNWNVW